MTRRGHLPVWSLLTACAVGPSEPRDVASLGEESERDGEAPDALVMYELVTIRDAHGEEVSFLESGELPEGVAEQVARPWSYRDEPFVYQEEAWETNLDDGAVEQGYRITRMVREADDEDPELPLEIAPELLEAAQAAPDTVFDLHLRLRDFPEWDIPPRPNSSLMSAEDMEIAATRRDDALSERQELAEAMAADVRSAIEENGGFVTAVRGTSGWLWARVPGAYIESLSQRDDVGIIRVPDAKVEPAAWRQGDGRWSTRMNADVFHSAGWDGGIANPDRHAFGRLVAAVIEALPDTATVAGFEDEACAFYDGANCTGSSRILGRYKCDAGPPDPCHFVPTGFAESEENNHGTAVAGAILSDYDDGQGCGKWLNDPLWLGGASCHSQDWEASATGMSPESKLLYFAGWGSTWPGTQEAAFADAISFAHTFGHADVINLSFGFEPVCNEDTGLEMQDEVENAFDDGALVVASVGNTAGPSSNCNIQHPSSTIKALAVNAFDAVDPVACETNYHSWCLVDFANSARGGMTANVAGTLRIGALTGVGLVGPNEVIRYTSNSGDFGDVSEDFTAPGTSYAAPTVAGLALVMKHRMLHFGNAWINSPGRLQTVMLAMGDRHYSINPTSKATSTSQRSTQGDVLYGFGRPTLRKMNGSPETPTGFNMVAWNTRTATHTYFPFGVLPSGTELVKCVLHQHEDLSGATATVADFSLRLRVTTPVGGACSSAGAQVGSALIDGSYDVKSMVALEDDVARPLAGNCVEVRILPVAADRVTSTSTFCYYSGMQDDE